MKKYTSVIFDLDGTMLDTISDLTDAINAGLTENGFVKRSEDEIKAYAGGGIANTVARCVGGGVLNAKYDAVLARCKEYYEAHCLDKTEAFLGIDYLLDGLTEYGFKLAVVTNKSQSVSEKLVHHFFGDKIAVIIGGSADLEKKPSPDALLKAAQLLDCDITKCVYVGDSEVDVETAKNAGAGFIGATWGFRTYGQLYDAGARDLANMPFSIAEYLFIEQEQEVQVPDHIRELASAMDFDMEGDEENDGDEPQEEPEEGFIFDDPFSGNYIDMGEDEIKDE